MKENYLSLNLQFFADGEETIGENATDTADQSEVVTDEQTTDTEPSEPTGNEPTPQDDTQPTPVQSPEDNTKFATARRQAEWEFAERQKSVDLEYQRRFSGYVNPLTNQPIRSQKDYLDALDAQEVVKQHQELQEKGIDPNIISQIVNKQVENNPVVRQAQQITQKIQQEQANKMLEEDLSEISKLDQNIKSFEDIANLPNIADIVALTNQGMNLSTAFKVANLDNLIQGKSAAVKQATINNLKGTQHLNATNNISANNDSSVDIPSSELSNWQDAYPNLSMTDLRKKYNQTL